MGLHIPEDEVCHVVELPPNPSLMNYFATNSGDTYLR